MLGLSDHHRILLHSRKPSATPRDGSRGRRVDDIELLCVDRWQGRALRFFGSIPVGNAVCRNEPAVIRSVPTRHKRIENSRFPAPLGGGAMLKAPMLYIPFSTPSAVDMPRCRQPGRCMQRTDSKLATLNSAGVSERRCPSRARNRLRACAIISMSSSHLA